jgi:cbb3-type cytochrome oxidase maturation protein
MAWSLLCAPEANPWPAESLVEALYFLLPLSGIVVVAALLAFRWAAAGGQFDDLETPAYRVLFDDQPVLEPHLRELPTPAAAPLLGETPRED